MRLHRRLLGGACVLATICLWVAASFLSQYLVRDRGGGDGSSLSPVLLVYLSTALFALYIPLLAAKRTLLGVKDGALQENPSNDDALRLVGPLLPCVAAALPRAAPVAAVWLLAQLLFTWSLALTSVTSNTILSSSSSAFTLLASAIFLSERVTIRKAACVAAVMAGTAMVALADDDSSIPAATAPLPRAAEALAGDALCVGSAAAYSIYTVMMQARLQEDDTDAPALLFGCIGLLTALAGLPVLAVAAARGALAGVTQVALGLAVLNGLLDYVAADYFWARAVLLLSPTAATLGLAAQIPLACIGDALLGEPVWLASGRATALTAGGALAILCGVFLIHLGDANGRGAAAVEVTEDVVPLLAADT